MDAKLRELAMANAAWRLAAVRMHIAHPQLDTTYAVSSLMTLKELSCHFRHYILLIRVSLVAIAYCFAQLSFYRQIYFSFQTVVYDTLCNGVTCGRIQNADL